MIFQTYSQFILSWLGFGVLFDVIFFVLVKIHQTDPNRLKKILFIFLPSDTFTSGNLFPVYTPFTLKLAMINSYGTGVFSEPISSILAENFSANQAIITSVVYNNKDTFSAIVTTGTVDSDYDVKIKLEITDNDDVNNKVVVDDYKNEVINSLTIGKTYKSVCLGL